MHVENVQFLNRSTHVFFYELPSPENIRLIPFRLEVEL